MTNKRKHYYKDGHEHSILWDTGFKTGCRCNRHPDQVTQETWNKNVLSKYWTQEEYWEWSKGYFFGKKPIK